MAQKQTHQATKSHSSRSQPAKSQGSKAETPAKGHATKGHGSNPSSPAHLQKFLAGVDYPAQKQDLIEKAKQEGADPEVMRMLTALPDRQYASPVGVSKELGKLN